MIDTKPYFNFRDAERWTHTFKRTQREYIKKTVKPVEPLAVMLGRAYADTARKRSYVAANLQLREATHSLTRHDLNLSWNDDELCRWCEHRAQKCVPLLREAEGTDSADAIADILERGAEVLGRYGIEMPDPEKLGALPVLRRLVDPKWWRLKARRLQALEVERIAILLGRVRKGVEVYCSDTTVKRRSAQRWRNRKYLENTEAENQDGQRYTLAELADLSISNPRIRRGELMMRVRGFDECAQLLGHVREFWTLTSPSRCHRWTTAGGFVHENGKWDKTTPSQAQRQMGTVFQRIRTALGNRGVRLYGFRVVEANHDGTPHWHMAVFYMPVWTVRARFSHWPRIPVNADDDNGKGKTGVEFYPCELGRAASPRVRAIVRRYALQFMEEGDAKELGAKKHRALFEVIDPERGDAAGYLAKYITKAIDATDAGDLVQQDLYGYDMQDSARRVEAWASCNRIRQFQQIGGPSVTAWREMRRAMADEVTQADLFDAPKPVQLAAEAADEGEWLAFVLLMGGPMVKRADQLVRLGYWHEHDAETGEVIGQVFDRYGGEAKARIYGLSYAEGAGNILTRVHTWTVHRPGEEKPQAETCAEMLADTHQQLREMEAAREWAPWSIVAQLRAAAAVEVVEKEAKAETADWFCFLGGANAPPLEFCQ
ncbi:MAG: bacteriophage replication family protein [Moraxellaceae bacterium]|jgi:hypothetical protein|nr:bacteriophage replication family protein [Moraxellaceae bacterium]